MRNPDPANWGKWSLIPQPELWQAVCLSMNFEPPKSCDVVEFLRLDQKTFKDRMQVCMANLGGKLTAVDTHTYHFSPKTARVNLATFAAVVSKWGWPIPQQLQALEQHAPKFEAWPLNSEPQPAPATTDTNKTKRQDGLSTPDIAVLFDNAPYPSHQWGRRTSDRKWLESARLAMGAQGGAPAMWCPLKLGRLVWEKYPDSQNKLRKTFQQNPALDPWRDEWDQFVDQFSDDD